MTPTATRVEIDWQAAGDEAIEHLRALLRLDTRNPPGNEQLAVEYIAGVLDGAGISYEIVGPSPDRATIVARLRGDGTQAPLLLMSHTDVVAVDREKWTRDPFGGETGGDDFLYGRGALDMKNMVAMELMTLLLLKRSGVSLKRDVIFMAAADEETGGTEGAGWVVQHRPELIQAEYALNEGGGNCTTINGRRYYPVQVGEKGTARFRLIARGQPGHGSQPHDNNAVLKLVAVLERLHPRATPVHITSIMRAFVLGIASSQPSDVAQAMRAVLDDESGTDAAIDGLPVAYALKQTLRAIARNTVAPTMLAAGSQINVIPTQAEAHVDARILPGWDHDMFREELRPLIGDDVEFEWVKPAPALLMDVEGPLYDMIREVLATHDPEATAVPAMTSGGTDAKHVTQLGIKVYGFAPGLDDGPDEGARVHGNDERISLRSLRWGTQVLYEVVERFAGA